MTDASNNQTNNTYRYDANGNMTCRIENSQTFIQAFNIENRLSGIALVSGDCDTPGDLVKTWMNTYDGDGKKVKQVYTDTNGTMTSFYYAGGSYEVQTDGTTSTIKQYYSIAGINVGMRQGSTFNYFLTDHLGSVVGVTDAAGTLISETRYMPFGQIRTDIGTITQTDYGFTFQQNVGSTGLMDYDARMYDDYLNRWLQPDTIIPDPYNSQSWNRFSYTRNNSVNKIDPSGNRDCSYDGKNCLNYNYFYHKVDIPRFIKDNSSPQLDTPKDVEQLFTSEEGKDFIMNWEQKSLILYDNDGANNCTIGYGHLVHIGRCNGYDPSETLYLNGISDDYAKELFNIDLANKGENIVKKFVTVPLYQFQFDALVSFAYNVGPGYGIDNSDPDYVQGFSNSSLLEYVNSGQFNLVPSELNKWIYPLSAGGLVTRREQEGNMFSEAIYNSAH